MALLSWLTCQRCFGVCVSQTICEDGRIFLFLPWHINFNMKSLIHLLRQKKYLSSVAFSSYVFANKAKLEWEVEWYINQLKSISSLSPAPLVFYF